MPGVRVIAGLGNPGPRYRNTRHNIGFMVLDRLAGMLGAAFEREKYAALVAETMHEGQRVVLLKPLTYMNRSGLSVAEAVRNTPDGPRGLLVVTDDVNLPMGRLRLRGRGSAGGHNGLKSCIEHLGTQDFARLRIGVGMGDGSGPLTGHVLGTFTPAEAVERDRAVEAAAEAVLCYLNRGLEEVMNRFNQGSPSKRKGGRLGEPTDETHH